MSDLFVEGIDDELWDMMDVDRRTKKEIVETALWEHYGGRKKTSLEAKLEHKKNERKAVKQSIEAEEEQLERVDREIRAIETKIEKFDKTEDAYYSALDDLLDRLESDDLRRLVPAACADVGENFGKDPDGGPRRRQGARRESGTRVADHAVHAARRGRRHSDARTRDRRRSVG